MPATVEDPTPSEFEALVEAHDVVVVDFSAGWCAPCRAYTPKFLRAAREMRRAFPEARAAFVTVDIDRAPEIARRFGVASVPTTVVIRERRGLLFRRKREAKRWSGDRPWGELVRELTEILAKARGAP